LNEPEINPEGGDMMIDLRSKTKNKSAERDTRQLKPKSSMKNVIFSYNLPIFRSQCAWPSRFFLFTFGLIQK